MSAQLPQGITRMALLCPYCKRENTAAAPLDTELQTEMPEPGSPIVCMYCAGAAILGDDYKLQLPTPPELVELENDAEYRDVSDRILRLLTHEGQFDRAIHSITETGDTWDVYLACRHTSTWVVNPQPHGVYLRTAFCSQCVDIWKQERANGLQS